MLQVGRPFRATPVARCCYSPCRFTHNLDCQRLADSCLFPPATLGRHSGTDYRPRPANTRVAPWVFRQYQSTRLTPRVMAT